MKCNYRNCQNEFEPIIQGGNKKEYCCQKHKQMEQTYRKRENKKNQKKSKLSNI